MRASDTPLPSQPRAWAAVCAFFRSLGAALCVGFILFFFSETLFWGRPGRSPLSELIVTWLAYSVLAGALLCALAVFHVRSLAALVLCGALYGWLSEGVLAGTLYDAFPLQVSWTGLAWHDLLSVCAGWYGLNVALRHSTARAVMVTTGLGVFWGTWAVMWWQPLEGGIVTPLPDFAAHAFTHGALLAAAFAVVPRLLARSAFTSHSGHTLLVVALGSWFTFITLPPRPFALLIAVPLFALTLFALRRHRMQPPTSNAALLPTMTLLRQPLPWPRCLALLVISGSAVIVYGLFLLADHPMPTNQVIFWILTPLGFLAYALSVGKAGFWKSHTEK